MICIKQHNGFIHFSVRSRLSQQFCEADASSFFVKSNPIQIVYLKKKVVTFDVSSESIGMIISFGNDETELTWKGVRVKKWSLELQKIGRRKLRMLHNSVDLADLKIPPSNRLEKLSGNLKDYYSIRINNQWRILFKWNNGNASLVTIIDYH